MARGFSLSRGPVQPATTLSSNESLSSSRVWTPLRENYFEPPLLSSRERAYLVRKSCEASLELVRRTRSAGGPIAWRHIEKNNGVQFYSGSLCTTATGAALTFAIMCGVTSIPGTITEVASLFQLSSTRQMKEFARAHLEWFYDGVVLHTLAPRTKEKPLHQVTAKWMVIQMPQGLPHRDFCFLECQDKFIDNKGRKGWVLGQHSIKLPGCGDLKEEFGFVRGSLYHSGFVVVESEERAGHVDVIYLVQLNLKEHTPVSANLLRERVMFIVQVRNMLRSKRLNEQRYLSDLELVPRKYRARCVVCQDSFSLLLLRKLNCRKCGEVVCAACSKEFPIENRNFAATNGHDEVRKLRICMHCFRMITNAPKPTSALVEPPHASTMSMSFLGYHDDEQQASLMTLPVNEHQGHQRKEQVKIFLQSMGRDKPSRRLVSSTLPIPDFGADVLTSNARHRTRGGPDDKWYQRPLQQNQKHQLDSSFSLDYRDSQRLRSSDFKPSQSLSLDDPVARREGRYTMQQPGHPESATPASIFDRPDNGDYRRSEKGMLRSRSTDMLLGTSERNMSNFSRLQVLSSRERLEQLQRQDNYMTRSSIDHRMPDAYMSALEQASRDKLDFNAQPSMYQAPPSDFGAFSASVDNRSVIPADFGPYDSTVDDQSGLELRALTTAGSSSPFSFDSINSTMLPEAPRIGKYEQSLLRRREHEIRQRSDSTSSDSSAFSIDIDSNDDLVSLPVVPSIAEHLKPHDEESGDRVMYDTLPFGGPGSVTSVSKKLKAAYLRDTDEDSETSMGASDDEEEHRASVELTSLHQKEIDDDAEESKGYGLDQTLALPSTFSSAHKLTKSINERPSSVNLSTFSDGNDETVNLLSPNKAKNSLSRSKQRLQRSKPENLIDYEHYRNDRTKKHDEKDANTFASCKYSDQIELKQRLSEIGDEVNSCSPDYEVTDLNQDTQQVQKSSLLSHQSRNGSTLAFQKERGMVALSSNLNEVSLTIPPTTINGVLPLHEHVQSSPNRPMLSTVPVSTTGSVAVGYRQNSGETNFESRLRASNEVSLSPVPRSCTLSCHTGLESFMPSSTSSSSPVAIDGFSTTSASSPAISRGDNVEASGQFQGNSNSFYEGHQQLQASASANLNQPRQNSVRVTALGNFQRDALDGSEVHGEQKSHVGGAIGTFSRLQTLDKRSRTTATNSKDEQMHRK